MNKQTVLFLSIGGISLTLAGCDDTYELHKYYRDSNSLAAVLMGSTYAGVVDEYNSLAECLEAKSEVEKDDLAIGYTNSRFECREK